MVAIRSLTARVSCDEVVLKMLLSSQLPAGLHEMVFSLMKPRTSHFLWEDLENFKELEAGLTRLDSYSGNT